MHPRQTALAPLALSAIQDYDFALPVKTSMHKCPRDTHLIGKQSHRPVWWPAMCHWTTTTTPDWQHALRRHHSSGQALHGFAAQSHGPSCALCPALPQSVPLRTSDTIRTYQCDHSGRAFVNESVRRTTLSETCMQIACHACESIDSSPDPPAPDYQRLSCCIQQSRSACSRQGSSGTQWSPHLGCERGSTGMQLGFRCVCKAS